MVCKYVLSLQRLPSHFVVSFSVQKFLEVDAVLLTYFAFIALNSVSSKNIIAEISVKEPFPPHHHLGLLQSRSYTYVLNPFRFGFGV